VNRRRTSRILVGFLVVGAAACSPGNESTTLRTKNAVVPTTVDPTIPVSPDHELTVVTASRPESARFGTRVAIERGMVFASAPGVPAESEGAVFASAYSEGWSAPVSVLSSWDWRFGRDLAVHNLNAVASASESRSALFGNRSGAIQISAAPFNPGLVTSFRLTGAFAQSSDDAGRAVAISDSYVAASAPMAGFFSTPSPFVAIGSIDNARAWDNVSIVRPGDVTTNGSFGTSLALSDSTLVVGADSTFGGKGSVFIYSRSGSEWTLAQRIDGSAGDAFGADVALVGSRMVVGAPGVDKGAVYVCEKAAGTWTCPVRVAYPNAGATGARAFGTSVAMSGSGREIAVGAPWAFGMSCCPGEAFTYEIRDDTWALTRTLRPTTPANADLFGSSVAIDGGVAVVGSPRGAGTVSIFGTPAPDRRAPRASVALDAPTVGSPLVSRISVQGGAAEGFTGSLTAWDRVGNRWEATSDTSTGMLSGTWPDATNFYGVLTAYNSNGYQAVALSGSIATPPTTTVTPTSSPATTTAPPPMETVPTTPTPVAPVTSAATPSPTPRKTVPTTMTPVKPANKPTVAPTSTPPATPTSTPPARPTTAASPVATDTNPQSTTFSANCQVRRPCTVVVAALAGAKSASTRGAPTGIRYNIGRNQLTGIPRKQGQFEVVIIGSRDGKRGSVTVQLTVK
jgi:hypothetical protein